MITTEEYIKALEITDKYNEQEYQKKLKQA